MPSTLIVLRVPVSWQLMVWAGPEDLPGCFPWFALMLCLLCSSSLCPLLHSMPIVSSSLRRVAFCSLRSSDGDGDGDGDSWPLAVDVCASVLPVLPLSPSSSFPLDFLPGP